VIKMAVSLRVQRSRGALSGVLLVLLGIWGAMIPFVGPYFHYAYTPDSSWAYTAERMWLEILPGIAAILGGLVVLGSGHRAIAILGAWLAAVGGAWFAVGNLVAVLWTTSPAVGTPVGGKHMVLLEQVGFFTGLGVVIVFVAALALGRFTIVSARDTAPIATKRAPAEPAAPKRELPKVSLVPAWMRSRLAKSDDEPETEKASARTR
jgi:hypothetical protein